MAKLYFRYGAMGSSKTANALMVRFNYMERGMKVLMLKPERENRDGENVIRSRIGLEAEALSVEKTLGTPEEQVLKEYDAVIVDEVQFLEPGYIEKLAEVVDTYNIPVIGYGLRTDFQGHLFEGSKRLMELADVIEEIPTVCWCGRKAHFNARIQDGKMVTHGEVFQQGGNESYVALCRKHFFGKQITLEMTDGIEKDEESELMNSENTKQSNITMDTIGWDLAHDPDTSPSDLSTLAKEEDKDIRRAVAQNPNTSPEDLSILSKDDDWGVREAVAQNPNTSQEDIAALLKDNNIHVFVAAETPDISPESLSRFTKDDVRWKVREAIAESPNTSQEDLSFLARDEDERVRRAVAANTNTSQEDLSFLARDKDDLVRIAVARNPNTSQKVLSVLAEDEREDVCVAVAQSKYRYSQEVVDLICRRHEYFLEQGDAGWLSMCADFSRKDIHGLDFSGRNLSGAIFTQAEASGANFTGANLSGADCKYMILRDADLSGADLSSTDLQNAVLEGTKLDRAVWEGADVSGTSLEGVSSPKKEEAGPIGIPDENTDMAAVQKTEKIKLA